MYISLHDRGVSDWETRNPWHGRFCQGLGALVLALALIAFCTFESMAMGLPTSSEVVANGQTPTELVAARNGELAFTHYVIKPDGSMIFEPVEGCRIPPLMPMYLLAVINFTKAVVLTFIFWSAENVKYPSMLSRISFYLITFYQFAMVPVTVCLTLHNVLFKMGPFKSTWGHYQCFGIVVQLGPWYFNALVLAAKWYLKQGYTPQPDRESIGDNNPKVIYVEWLIQARSDINYCLAAVTLVPYMILQLPFIITHIIPGLFVFLPEVVLFTAVAALVVGCLLFGGMLCVAREDDEGHDFECEANWLPLMGASVVLFTNILLELFALQETYLYDGLGYWNTYQVAWEERRAAVYFANMYTQVLQHAAWLSDLVSEAF